MPVPLAETSLTSEKSAMPFYLSSEQALQEYLESSGVDTSKFGKGNAKPLAWLYQELQEGTCYLESPHPLSPTSPTSPPADRRPSRLLRVVEPIFIRLRFRSRVLVQDKQQFPDGRFRVRNMLLAEKKEPRDSGGLLSTIHRAINEELGVSLEDLRREDVMQYRPDTYHFEIEHIDSPSYPGLASAYRTHHVQVDILETGLDAFMHCGLPEFSDFVTTEKTSHGVITLFWRWDDVNTALKRGVVKFPPKSLAPKMARPSLSSVKSSGSLEAPEKSVLPANVLKDGGLAFYLKKAGIDPDAYGRDKAKSLDSLLKEVECGETVLEWNDATNQIRRIVEPVFVQLRWGDQVLVEQEQIMSDGRTRSRNMLLAEKKKPEDTVVEQTVYRGLAEELLENYHEVIPDVSFHVRFMQEAYCCVAENLESSSYPGLPCVYITHYCAVQLLDSGLPAFEEIGMLEPQFDTKEEDGKINRWRWVDLDEARKTKVKGFPKLDENQNADTIGLWQLIESAPDDIGDLRVLLEMGGVNVSAWGMYAQDSLKSLLHEIQSGASTLERDDISGKVRRVICSSLVQLKVSGPKEAEKLNPGGLGFDLGDARSMVNYRADRGVWEVLHSDTASYPGLPCCYQTRLVQFESLKREALLKLPSDIVTEKIGGDDSKGHGRRNSQRSSQASSLGSLTVPMSVMSPCQSSLASVPGSLDESPIQSRQHVATDPKAELVDLPVEAVGIYRQVLHMHKDLRFRMVAKEASEKSAAPATNAVSCSCEILLIRNINPLTATYQCRFYIFMEWFDPAAIGMPPGDVSEENRKKLWIPEIALQNTLKTGVEIHYPPEIVFSEKGHVAAKVLYQAIMQMEIDMRLFPFDTQRLNIVLGLRARRDRDRAVFCRFCHVDSTIRLDEWKLLGAFHHTDRPDGRARVQFGVIIGRGYMYYVLNVLITLCAIASSFAGYLLQMKPPFDRLRFCISILFAQTTFRLSIDSKLPIVAYATAFDHFAMACQLLLLSIILGVVIVVMLSDRWFGFGGEAAAEVVDKVFMFTLMPVWIFTLLGFSIWVARARREHQKVLQFNHDDLDKDQQEDGNPGDFSPDAVEQVARLKGRLRYTSARRLSPTEVNISTDAVAVSTMVWFIHDIDPIQAQYECKFTAYIEWLSPNAVGLPEHIRLSKEELISLNMPEIDVRNKVELKVEEGPDAYVTDSTVGRIMVSTRYLAKLQLRLKLRNFPFDEQSLPIDFVMPSEKDNRRAFVFRNCELAPLAKNLDEWTVKDTWTRCDFHEGMSQAAMFVQVRRNSKYYVVSVLSVMLGISSLVFTVWCIEVDEKGRGFDDQGKILTPLLMTLLAFKLLTASGKIPKVAKATIFDRYVLATEACFFVTVFSCSLLRALITSGPEMAKMGGLLRFSFGLVLLLTWLVFLLCMAREVKRAKEEESRDETGPVHIPGFESACEKILQKPLIPICTFKRKAVLMEITIKHVFAINPAAANFTCEFEVNMAWLDAKAKQMPSGTKLDKEKCKKLGLPKLSVQNAQSCTMKFESGRIIDGQSGHVACKLKIKAQVLMTFDLRYFPWDEQSLFVVMVLNSQEDAHRYLVLKNCVSVDSVKAGEWAELGSFAKSYETGGNSKALFGLQIKRFSRYYVTSLASLCLWSTFILFVYVLAVNDFRERGKIMVGVLLVQNVAKVAVSSKMPRVVRITAYDNMALNSLGLLFSIGICNALLDGFGQLKIPGLTFEVLTIVDRCLGLVLFCTWLLANAYVIFDVAKHSSEGKAVKAGNLPRQVAAIVPPDYTEPEEVLEDVEIIMRSPDPLSVDSAVRKTCSRSSELLGGQVQVKVGVKFWLISDIDVASATYLAKFHVIMEWFDQAAVGVPVSTRISYEKLRDEAGRDGTIVVPQVGLKNAITVSLEEYSDVIVLEDQKGLVTCRVHFNANLHNEFCLESFPFDCQRLLAELQLVNTGFELVPNFCNAGEQLKSLDGWNFTTAALAQPDDDIAANRQRVLVNVILERQSGFFVKQVLSIYWFLTTLMFSFFVLGSDDFTKRLVDILKIVLTQTTFRFSVEHRLPKVQVWTPFDVYLISCQILCCFIAAAYLASFIMSQHEEKVCLTQEVERLFLLSLASLWVVWNLGFIIYAIHRKRQERVNSQQSIMGALEMSRFSGLLPRYSKSPFTVKRKGSGSDGEEEMSPVFSHRGTGVEAFTGTSNQETQVISIAFRIWLIRNVDLVKATFECKFRVFLEWLDEAAVGLEKGKKAKELKVPSLAITNAVQAEVLDRSSAPEVVNPATGHVAVQMLFRATLRMDQQVRHFPFDCQWLAVTVSLKEEGCAQNRSFVFQYCEVDEGLSLDEWYLCPDPAFSTLTKQDAPSIQDTVMCGLLIRRASRYYVVNIMLMLGLISSIAFAIYTVKVSLFWERAEVFLGIFPLIVIFKMSAQGKLPRVGYSTKFDRFATACQTLFLVIVMGCMAASFIPNVPTWFRPCTTEGPVAFAGEALLAEVEHICCYVLISMWLAWIVWFTWQARQAQRLDPVENMQSRVPVKLQGRQHAPQGSCEASVEGLAPSLSIVAQEEKKRTKRPSLLVALGIVEDKEKHEKQG